MLTKLANVFVEDTEQYARRSEMWVRGTHQVTTSDTSRKAFTLPANGTYDFLTFYNALSLRKWNEYTTAKDYELHITLNGDANIRLTYADAFSYRPQEYDSSDVMRAVKTSDIDYDEEVIKVPDSITTEHGTVPVLVGFTIETGNEKVVIHDCGWYAHVDEKDVRDVSIAVCTTTFKKEKYITENIRRVRENILYGDEKEYDRHADEPWFDEVSRHFRMNVIDNGRTLDTALSGNGVTIYPNPNVGGSGGFARGMIEAMSQGVTHVLLMDDDVVFSTESFVRTFNVLRIVKDKYKDAFVSGGMMSAIDPNIFTEDTGFMNYDGYCIPIKPQLSMDFLHDVVTKETFQPPRWNPKCQDTTQEYAAWWFCCIPMTEVRKRGLPLPLFVRFDDIEYSLRTHDANQKFITMNGINVWHEPFFIRYDAAVERYQITRNSLIISHASDAAPLSDFVRLVKRNLDLELKRLDYEDAELVLDGFEDFLEGPDTVFAPGFAEEAFIRTHKDAETRLTWDEAKTEARKYGVNLDDIEPDDVLRDYPRTRPERAYDYLTVSGQMVPCHLKRKGKNPTVAIMERHNGSYQPGATRNADIIIAIDIQNKLISIRHRDDDICKEIVRRYRDDMREYKRKKEQLTEAYHEAAIKMRTVDAWKHYLGLDGDESE